jgi:hypothetical protein
MVNAEQLVKGEWGRKKNEEGRRKKEEGGINDAEGHRTPSKLIRAFDLRHSSVIHHSQFTQSDLNDL